MIPISLPPDFAAFMLRTDATLATAQPLYLARPTQISDLIVTINGRKEDLEGTFGLMVTYFNEAGNSLTFHFSATVHDKNEVEIVHQINRPDFLCTHIKFLPGSFPNQKTGAAGIYHPEPLILIIKAFKFDDESEKMHFLEK